MNFWKRAAAVLALVVTGIVAALIVGEVALRLFGFSQPDFYIYDRWRGWALNPGVAGWQREEGDAYFSINRYGFRGPAVNFKKAPDVYRIAVLGDSFTEASQVNYSQTFSAVMQRRLAQCPALKGKTVQVLDFGVDSYGTAQEYLTLKHQALTFSPDAVVLAIFTGNDIRNNSVVLEGDKCRPFYTYKDGKLVLTGPFEKSSEFRLNCMARFESRHSAVANLVGGLHRYIMAAKAELRGVVHVHRIGHTERGLSSSIYSPPGTAVRKEAWKITEGEIEMTNRLATSHGARFFAVTLANPTQDLPLPAVRARFMRRHGITNLFYPDYRIKALGERDDFPVLNLAPLLQKYADANSVYLHGFANTRLGIGHWNAQGHREAGHLIAQWMCMQLSGTLATAKAAGPAPLGAEARYKGTSAPR